MSIKTIDISEHTVTKTDVPALMRVEVEKTQRAYTIGSESGLFRIPQVLDFTEDTGVAVFERLHGIQPFRFSMYIEKQWAAFAKKLGTSLAIIHTKLKLPNNMIFPLPAELDSSREKVFIHGDLSTENVYFAEDRTTIVILDWQMTGRHGGQATYGTRYFDLIWFINNLIYRPRIRYLFGNALASIIRIFLEAYFENAEIQYDGDAFGQYTRRFFKIKHSTRKKNSSRRERFLISRSHALAEMFIDLLQTIGEKTCR
ncbi:MAG: phosphotransferase [Planctomycetes bacterium]|nr:phosphotransferase [Planctomycetota bacterium]